MARNREKDAQIVRNLKRFIAEAGWSAPIFAAAIGMQEGQLYKIFAGENGAELHVKRFADALQRSSDDLYDPHAPKQKPLSPPVFMLKVRPKAKPDPAAYERALACIAEANRAHLDATRKQKR